MKEGFAKEVQQSMYVHMPLPLHEEKSLENTYRDKKILQSKVLWNGKDKAYEPAASELTVMTVEGGEEPFIRITAPVKTDHWPAGAEENGNYSNFGNADVIFTIPREDWTSYNRLHFQARPMVKGGRCLYMNANICNDGEIKVPDHYMREGDSMFAPKNREWKDYYWEFDAMARDCITQVKLYVNLTGQETCMDDTLTYEFRNITVEQVAEPEKEKGWGVRENQFIYSTAGYLTKGTKTAILKLNEMKTFTLHRAEDDAVVYEGEIREIEFGEEKYGMLDFSAIEAPGSYYLIAGAKHSEVFSIGEDIIEESLWKILNFIFCERCGTPVPERHQACHMDMIAHHNGVSLSFAGGWHDAGDVSQQAEQTGEVVFALCEAASRLEKDSMLRKRLLEEAQWGLDYILRTRFGDGYRATSAAATRITNGLAGDMDDIIVRVHNHAFENYMFAGIEAYAAYILREDDQELSFGSLKTAKEDYLFAEEEFAKEGVHPADMFEHTYNSSLAQYYAVICWASSNLYLASGEKQYAGKAEEYADRLLACQETGAQNKVIAGYFYRDESHKEIVHFNHQSREHQFMQALALLCETQPDNPQKTRWETAMKSYGDYLKFLMQYASPYQMIPAGVHRRDEYQYSDTFQYLHITVNYEKEVENYKKQLEEGISIDGEHVIRQFPVWFSFRGNNAVLLSEGKAASILGRYFDDEQLLQIGKEQMYWVWGKNPFGQSLQYGMGSRYCHQYSGFCGEAVGEMPVGIETYQNEDVPYWPQNTNATYKEVWMSSVGRFLSLAADYTK